MKPNDFEQKLQRQELRPLPREWREEILDSARAAGARPSTLDSRRSWLAALLWPHPRAWAGLAAAWLVIVVVNLSAGDEPAHSLARQAAPPPQLLDTVREQRRELARLIEPPGSSDADRPKKSPPRPRSDWRGEFLNA